jgi:hypothetical protein
MSQSEMSNCFFLKYSAQAFFVDNKLLAKGVEEFAPQSKRPFSVLADSGMRLN